MDFISLLKWSWIQMEGSYPVCWKFDVENLTSESQEKLLRWFIGTSESLIHNIIVQESSQIKVCFTYM